MPAEELFAMDEIARSRKLLRQREAEIDKKSSVVLRQNAVKKYAYLERCYGSAQIRRQSVYPFVEPAKWNWDVGAEFRISI